MTFKRSLMLALVAGAGCTSGLLAQPLTSTNLTPGGPITVPSTLTTSPFTLSAATVQWYRIDIGAGVTTAQIFDLAIRSGSTPATDLDTLIGLYLLNGDNSGTRVGADDDSGVAAYSQLSYGATCPARLSQQAPLADGVNFAGGSGATLAPGTYYLGVTGFVSGFSFPASFASGPWNPTTTHTKTGTYVIRFTLDNAPIAGPTISASAFSPGVVDAGAGTVLTATLAQSCSNPATLSGLSVTANFSAFGGPSSVTMLDNGVAPDAVAGDNIFTVALTAPAASGNYSIPITATNALGGIGTRNASLSVNGVASQIKISQINGAGGLGATGPQADYVELYNAGASSASLAGYSLQINSGGTSTSWTNILLPSLTLPPGGYVLVRCETASATGTAFAAAPDVVNTSSPLSSTSGKAALMRTATTLTVSDPQVGAQNVFLIDFIGYGTSGPAEGTRAAGPGSAAPIKSLVRQCGGSIDTNNNAADFQAVNFSATLAHNSASAPAVGGPSLGSPAVSPSSGLSPFATTITASASACGSGVTIASMAVNLSSVGGAASVAMLDNGLNGDGAANDGVFGLAGATITGSPGVYSLPIRVTDSLGRFTDGAASVTINVPPPANDNCPTATLVSGTGQFAYSNVAATTSTPAFTCGSGGTDVWFRWVAPNAGTYSFRTCDTAVSYDTVMMVYDGATGCPIDNTTALGCNDDGTTPCGSAATIRLSKIELNNLVGGNTYYIRVGTFNAGAGAAGTLTIEALGTRATGVATPATINELGTATFFVTVSPAAGATITSATVDTSSISSTTASINVRDDGVAPDVTAGDNIFTGSVVTDHAAGSFTPAFTVTDSLGNTAAGTMNLTIVVAPGACCTGGSCSIAGAVACITGGGTYSGAGTTCGGPSAYEILPSSNAFEDISSSGVRLATVSECDDCGETTPIGFDFNFFGGVFSNIWVCSNGFAQFGGANNTTFTNTTLPNSGAPNNILAPLWDDYDLDNLGGGNGDVYVLTDGLPGSRRCVISWQGAQQFNTAPAALSSFQIVLHEGSNAIEFRYGPVSDPTVNSDTSSATIGVENAAGTVATSYDVTLIAEGNTSLDVNVSASVPNPCRCATDINGDGVTDPDDLSDAIGCFFDPMCRFDYDHSGFVDPDDLSTYIGDFFTPGFCG